MEMLGRKEKIAYFAGIMDGEGTIGIYKRKPNHKSGHKNFIYRIEIRVTNTDVRLIEWLKTNFGGGIYPCTRQRANHKKAWEWRCGIGIGIKLLKETMPYLLLKKEQAHLAIKFQEKCTLVHFRRELGIPLDNLKKREEIYLRMKELNKRGVK